MLEDFKAFIMRGSAVDLAVGIVIGAAFTAIVNSMVADLITPLTNIFGTVDFSSWQIQIGQATLMPGNFLNAVVAFLIIAAVVFFLVVRPMARLQEGQAAQEAEQEEAEKEPEATDVELLAQIRDEIRLTRSAIETTRQS